MFRLSTLLEAEADGVVQQVLEFLAGGWEEQVRWVGLRFHGMGRRGQAREAGCSLARAGALGGVAVSWDGPARAGKGGRLQPGTTSWSGDSRQGPPSGMH